MAVNTLNYQLPYARLFGGAVAISRDNFRRVNGFSNCFFGWGAEDDDMYHRMKSVNLQVMRYPPKTARYTMIKHARDTWGEPWRDRGTAKSNVKNDGLSTLVYTLRKKTKTHLYTHLLADIQTKPSGCPSKFKAPLKEVTKGGI